MYFVVQCPTTALFCNCSNKIAEQSGCLKQLADEKMYNASCKA